MNSLISVPLGLQEDLTVKGSSTDPNNIVGLKHSLIVAISLADFCQEYHRQASPGSQYFLWLGSILSNISQSAFPLLPENKLPHW